MASESRIKKTFLNARMNLLTYSVALFVAFFTRPIFLKNLGLEFMGLSETLGSILSFLNIAELGVGSAIAYVLYKPLYNKNQDEINELISLLGVVYKWVGMVILVVGVIVSFFLLSIFSDTSFNAITIYSGYYSYLASSLAAYFFNYKSCLLSADQKNYIVTGYFQLTNFCRILIQVLLCLYVRSFILFFIIQFLFGLVNVVIINIKIRQHYPWLQTDLYGGLSLFKKYPVVYEKTKQLFIHKIGGVVQSQITPILIYKFVSMATVALYANYTMVTLRLKAFLSMALDGTIASIGNLIAEGDNEKTFNVFKEIFSIRALVAGVASASTLYLITPFIRLWLGPEYLLESSVPMIVVISMYFEIMMVCEAFVYGYGLFKDVWVPYVELTMSIILSLCGGYLWGLLGVLCGIFIPRFLLTHLWRPIFLFGNGFKKNVHLYYLLMCKYIILLLPCVGCAYFISHSVIPYSLLSVSWLNWLGGSLIFTIVMLVSYFSLLFISSVEFRKVIKKLIFLNYSC